MQSSTERLDLEPAMLSHHHNGFVFMYILKKERK